MITSGDLIVYIYKVKINEPDYFVISSFLKTASKHIGYIVLNIRNF